MRAEVHIIYAVTELHQRRGLRERWRIAPPSDGGRKRCQVVENYISNAIFLPLTVRTPPGRHNPRARDRCLATAIDRQPQATFYQVQLVANQI